MEYLSRTFWRSHSGGIGRRRKYSSEQLSQWARKGGRAILRKYGREYFRELKKKQKRRSMAEICDVWQATPRVTAAKNNGRLGGIARADRHSRDEICEWGRRGGLAVHNRYGSDHFRELQARSTKVRAQWKRYWDDRVADMTRPPASRRRTRRSKLAVLSAKLNKLMAELRRRELPRPMDGNPKSR